MKTIYDYFEDFTKIETPLFKIERVFMKFKGFLVFRIYKKGKKEEHWRYLGLTYIRPEFSCQYIDIHTLFYANQENKFFLTIHETPTLTMYYRLIQILLINYLKHKVKKENSFSYKHIKK